VHWQYTRKNGGADSAYLTTPQKQLPVRGEDGDIVYEDMAVLSRNKVNHITVC